METNNNMLIELYVYLNENKIKKEEKPWNRGRGR